MHKVVCLISVGSQRFDAALLATYSTWLKHRNAELFCVMLDGPERHNVKLFDGLEELDARRAALLKGAEAAEKLRKSGAPIYLWDEAIAMVPYKPWESLIFHEFERSTHFRHESLNETFRNLQPKFRRHGVIKKSSPLVNLVASYLLEEVAFKLAACCSELFVGEILPKPESNLVMSIYNGKYLPRIARPQGYKIIIHDGRHVVETLVGNDAMEATTR